MGAGWRRGVLISWLYLPGVYLAFATLEGPKKYWQPPLLGDTYCRPQLGTGWRGDINASLDFLMRFNVPEGSCAVRPQDNRQTLNGCFSPLMVVTVGRLELLSESFQKSFPTFLCSQRWRSSIQSTKTRPGADCGSDHELLITKFRLKLQKAGKTARPFRYDLNQIPYDYIVGVRNRFKGLDLIDRVPDELQNEVCDIVQETGIKTIPMEKKCKKAKWLSGEALQIAVKRREVKAKEKRKDKSIRIQSSKEQQGEIRKPSSVISANKQRKTIEWERLEMSSRK